MSSPVSKRGKHSLDGQIVEGTVTANRGGFGFLRVPGQTDDVFLPPPQMRGLLHGDRVRVRVAGDGSGRWTGDVQAVLDRGVTSFLGTIELERRGAWVSAADRRLKLRCSVAPADLGGAKNGDWVIARIHRYASTTTPAQAVIEKRLDPARPVELGTEAAIARFDLPHAFTRQSELLSCLLQGPQPVLLPRTQAQHEDFQFAPGQFGNSFIQPLQRHRQARRTTARR